MKSTIAVLALLLGSAAASTADWEAQQKSKSSSKLAKSSKPAKAATSRSSDKKASKFVFDPMHLHLGKDKKMHMIKQSAFLNDMMSSHGASKPSLRASADIEEKRRRLSAGLWDSIVSAFSSDTPATLLDVAVNANESVPEVPIADPPAEEKEKVHVSKEKPKKRAQVYFESKTFGGNKECEIKHNTFFSSHTYGIDACFLSSLSDDCFPIYTASSISEVLDIESDMKEAYNVVTKFYYDEACEKEFDHKGYYPLSELLTKECEEMEHLESESDDMKVVSKQAELWELSHAPHRETAGHQMSVSIYARGRDCKLGQADEAGKMLSLQERLTFYHGSKTCMENDDGHSYFMKCLPNEEISIHGFDNPNCEGEPKGVAILSREELCKAEWSGIYTTGSPVVQCGIGENWVEHDERISQEYVHVEEGDSEEKK